MISQFLKFLAWLVSFRIGIFAPIVLYILISSGVVLVQRPYDDDMQHANAAATLLNHGKVAVPIICYGDDPRGVKVNQFLYAQTVGIYFPLAFWFKCFGVGIFQLRFFTVFLGMIGIIAWSMLFQSIGIKNKNVLFISTLLLSVDFIYTRFTAYRPFEAAIIVLLAVSLLFYIRVRTVSLRWAIFLSQFCCAMAGTIHPNGLLVWAESLFIILYMDKRNLKWEHLIYYFSPYFIFGIPYFIYIMQDFETFKTQFFTNVYYESRAGIWNSIVGTIKYSFLEAYGFGKSFSPMVRILIVVLLVHLVSIIALFRDKNNYARFLLALIGIYLFFITFIFTHKWPMYVTLLLPLFSIITAIFLEKYRLKSFIPTFVVLIIIILSISVNLYRFKRNDYWKLYNPDMKVLKSLVKDNDILFAPTEVGFAVGMDRVYSDYSIGYYSKDERRILVVDKHDWENIKWQFLKNKRPYVYSYLQNKLKSYDLIYDGRIYDIYIKKEKSEAEL